MTRGRRIGRGRGRSLPERRATLAALAAAALLWPGSALGATAVTKVLGGPTIVAARLTAGGMAEVTVEHRVSGPGEFFNAAFYPHYCRNGDLLPSGDERFWSCFGEEPPGGRTLATGPELYREAIQLRAGSYEVHAAVDRDYKQPTPEGDYEIVQEERAYSPVVRFTVVDECRWTVTAASGLRAFGVGGRRGDPWSCLTERPEFRGRGRIALRSGVDGSRIVVQGSGALQTAGASDGRTMAMILALEGEGRLEYSAGRRFGRGGNLLSTDEALVAVTKGPFAILLRSAGSRTVVTPLRGGAAVVTARDLNPLAACKSNPLDPACLQSATASSVVLEPGQSTTVVAGRPPTRPR